MAWGKAAGIVGNIAKGVADEAGWDIFKSLLFKGKAVTQEGVGDMKSGPGQEHLVEGTILETCAAYVLCDPEKRGEFLKDNLAAHNRVVIVFYRRNPKLRDPYERFITQLPLWALSDGLGARTKQAPPAPEQPQQQSKQQKGGGQPTKAATPPSSTLDSEHIQLIFAFKVCLGMQALAADEIACQKGRKHPEAAGDKIIRETIERMRQASPFEQGKKALEKGGKSVSEFLDGLLEEI